jgi:hypothetical protein
MAGIPGGAFAMGSDHHYPRQGFIYFGDDGDLVALRFDNRNVVS